MNACLCKVEASVKTQLTMVVVALVVVVRCTLNFLEAQADHNCSSSSSNIFSLSSVWWGETLECGGRGRCLSLSAQCLYCVCVLVSKVEVSVKTQQPTRATTLW